MSSILVWDESYILLGLSDLVLSGQSMGSQCIPEKKCLVSYINFQYGFLIIVKVGFYNLKSCELPGMDHEIVDSWSYGGESLHSRRL